MSTPIKGVKRLRETHAEATRTALVEAATGLFVRHDYAETSLDQVAAAAGTTKGAIYHHFPDKKAVFRAVYEALSKDLIRQVTHEVNLFDPGPEQALKAFVNQASRPQYQSVLFRQGPTVLGASVCREIDMKYSLGLITQQIQVHVSASLIEQVGLPTLARMLLSIMVEGAQIIADAEHPETAAASVQHVLRPVLSTLTSIR